MENLIKNPNVLMVGAGVLAFVVANMIFNRKQKGTSQNEFSNFAGSCACANGVSGYCASNCSLCCKRSGGVAKNKQQASKDSNFEGESNSDFCGCGM
jgi:hypothetical protein